ncbi:MAG: ABC transporter ATP-binding protein/permease, partial [Anaerolineae bacterium]|nr:ABC transporter ATP-binding protein/permease [Anaerolineae bacterium]
MKHLGRLFSYLKPYWIWATIGPLLMVLEVMMDLQQPRLIAKIVDEGIALGRMDVVIQSGLAMVGYAFLGAAGGIGCGIFSVMAAHGFGADVRDALYRKVQSLSFANIDKLETGTLVTRLTNDVTQVQSAALMMLRMMVRAPLQLVGSLIMAIITSAALSPLFVVLIPIVMVTIGMIIKRAFPLFKLVQGKLDKLNTVMQENLMGVRVVKAFVREDHEEKRFQAANSDLMALAIKAGRTVSVGMPIMMLTVNVAIVAVLWFGGVRVVGGTMHVGQIIAFVNYLMRVLFSLMFVSMVFMHFSRAGASAERILEVLDTEPGVENSPIAITSFADASNNGHDKTSRPLGRVTFEGVTFAYSDEDSEPVLRDVNLTAEPGQTVAIMGATGSGKSTLAHLIPRFYDVQEGRVAIDGIDVRDLDKTVLRRNVGMAFQQPILFTGTIRDNICYGRPEATDEEVEAAARMAQAHDFIVGLPDGYDTELGQRGVNLSGGQKQRVAIARALATEPAV